MDRRHKVELFEVIRRGYAAGETIQGLSRKHGVHRRMVRQAIEVEARQNNQVRKLMMRWQKYELIVLPKNSPKGPRSCRDRAEVCWEVQVVVKPAPRTSEVCPSLRGPFQ